MQFTSKFTSLLVLATLACASPIRMSRGLDVTPTINAALDTVENVPVVGSSIVEPAVSTVGQVETDLANTVPGVGNVLSTVGSAVSRRDDEGLGLGSILEDAEDVPVVGTVVNDAAGVVDNVESGLESAVPELSPVLGTVDGLVNKRGLGVDGVVDPVVSDLENVPVVGSVVDAAASTLNSVETELSTLPVVGSVLNTADSLLQKRDLGVNGVVGGAVSSLENAPVVGGVVDATASTVNSLESELSILPGVSTILDTANGLTQKRGLGVNGVVDGAVSSLENAPVVGGVVDDVASTLDATEGELSGIPGVSTLLGTVNGLAEKRGLGVDGVVDPVVSDLENVPVVGSVVDTAASAADSVEGELSTLPVVGSVLSTTDSLLQKRGLGVESTVDGVVGDLENVPVAGSVVDEVASLANSVEGGLSTLPGVSSVLDTVENTAS